LHFQILAGYGALVGAALLIYFSGMFLISLIQAFNLPLDWPTLGFMVYNYFVVGALALGGFSGISQERADGSKFFNYMKTWRTPLRVNQFYHITVCTVVALLIQQMLPPWTAWMVLGLMACWDLFAVLSDAGPLKCLIKIIDDRGIQFPDALIYSTMITMVDTDETAGPAAAQRAKAEAKRARKKEVADPERAAERAAPERAAPAPRRTADKSVKDAEESGSGPKLGLGDFIFYSILMAAVGAVLWNLSMLLVHFCWCGSEC
jgi:presenilin 1